MTTERVPPPVDGDFYDLAGLLEEEDRLLLKRVRAFMEEHVAPIINVYWGKAEFPFEVLPAMAELGLTPPEVPSPLNMWMNIPVAPDGTIDFQPTVAKPGDYVLLRAEMSVVMAFSACPQDILPINSTKPVEAHVEIIV